VLLWDSDIFVYIVLFFDLVLSLMQPCLGFHCGQSASQCVAFNVNRYQSVGESLVFPFHERCYNYFSRSQSPRGLRCVSAAACLLGRWVRIPPEAWVFACCECCVLLGRGLCVWLVPCPEESYGVRCVVSVSVIAKLR
jgi:hypothetical protein